MCTLPSEIMLTYLPSRLGIHAPKAIHMLLFARFVASGGTEKREFPITNVFGVGWKFKHGCGPKAFPQTSERGPRNTLDSLT